MAAVAVGISFALASTYAAAGAAAGRLVGSVPLVLVVAKRLLALEGVALPRSFIKPAFALACVTVVYLAGRMASASLLWALVTGPVGTAAYLAAVQMWVLGPREREALLRAARPA